MSKKTNIAFTKLLNEIERIIPYTNKWIDYKGMFSNASNGAYSVNCLNPGEFAKSKTRDTQEDIIFIGTRFGTVSVVDSFRLPGILTDDRYSYNCPIKLNNLIVSLIGHNRKDINDRDLFILLGDSNMDYKNNIGFKIEEMANLFLL